MIRGLTYMCATIMVINLGMKSIRSVVFDENGQKLGFASQAVSTRLDGAMVTQDPNEWWEKAGEVARSSIDFFNGHIDYVTVTASSSCLICVDENSEALDSCIMVSDKRCETECDFIKSTSSYPSVFKSTGLAISTSCMLPKILWVKNHQNEVFCKTYTFLSPNDYFVSKMTGVFTTDTFNASKYHYETFKKSYPSTLLKEIGIDENALPKVNEVGYSVGSITKEASTHLGINEDACVVLSSYDAICSFFGSGVQGEGDACDVSGTVTTFRALTYKENLAPSTEVFTMPWLSRGLSIVGGSNNLGGGLAEWARQCLYSQEEYPYEVMELEAEQSPVGARGLIFLPYLLGERAPLWDNLVRGAFFGLERRHTRGDMMRAIYESAGFISADFIDAIEATGMGVNSVRLSGGLARTELVNQIKADVTGKEIYVLSDFETTASGAAILVFAATEVLTFDIAIKRFASVRMVIPPNYQHHEYYCKIRKLFKSVYSQTKDLFRERQELYNELYSTDGYHLANL